MSNNNTQYIPFKINSKIRQCGTEINDTTFYLNGLDQANEGYDIHLRNFAMPSVSAGGTDGICMVREPAALIASWNPM